MGLGEWTKPPRLLLVMFFGITVVSAASLGWLSWQLVRQDRDLATKRAQEGRDNAAGLAIAALQKHLSAVEERLTALANLPESEVSQAAAEYSKGFSEDSLLLIFEAEKVEAHPAGRLIYYPLMPPATQAPAGVFAEADAIQYQQEDRARAGFLLRKLSRSTDSLIRAEALLRLGQNLRAVGRWQEALAAYEQLAVLGNVPAAPPGIPAGLVARLATAAVFEERHDQQQLAREAAALVADLHSGRWRISRPAYDAFVDQALRWMSTETFPAPAPFALALAEAAQSLWKEWQDAKDVSGRQTLWTGDRSMLVLARNSTSRAVVLAVGSGHITSQWLAEVKSTADNKNVRIALADREGHPVVGPIDAPFGQHSLHLNSTTGLPWTLYAISVDGHAGPTAFSGRSQLVIAGVCAIALLVLGGSYLIGRAVSRELAVARLQSDFVSAVSHEFRTPLTALRQLSELLAQGRVASERVRQQYYEVLQQESGRLHRLVEGLLKFGRMEAGAVQYQFGTIDAAVLLRSLVDEFSREANRHGCQIELTVEASVPPTRADREALSCVIWNLLDNAVKYSPECRTVWVDLARERDHVAIRVRDHGAGISQADQQRIFRKFIRGDAAKALGVQGTGIGLAVAAQIVARHGGEIKLESQPGKGSTFSVLLPVAQ